MFKLLRADGYRVLRYKLFWILLCCYAVFSLILVLGEYVSLRSWLAYYEHSDMTMTARIDAFTVMRQGFGSNVCLLGFLCAILVPVLIGKEYTSGGMRNKIIAGGGRAQVYLSKLIWSCAMCAAVYLVFHFINFTLGSALMGWGGATVGEVLLLFVTGLLFVLAYAAIFTAVAMFSRGAVAGVVVSIVLVIAAWLIFASIDSNRPYDAAVDPETGTILWFNVEQVPVWLQEVLKGLLALMPTGQYVTFTTSALDFSKYAGETLVGNLGAYCAFSALWVALSAVGGSLLFRRLDLR